MLVPDPLRMAIALVPLAAYLLVIALLNARKRPFLTSGGAELAALGVALSGMILIGPIELFRPQDASAEYGSYVWLFLLGFYWLCLWLAVLLGRPRLSVYNISSEELRPLLSEAAREIDPQARWAGDSLTLPTQGVQLHVESFELMRHVSIISSGGQQNLTGWKQLAGQLYRRIHKLGVGSNPRWLGLTLLAVALMATSIVYLLSSPDDVVQAMREIFSY